MITATTKLIGFFADPASHSKSPGMHNAAFEALGLDYCYMAFHIPEGGIEKAVESMRTLSMRGANISMPHKEKVMEVLDEVDEAARLCGAVNTVVNRDGHLKGYNTDISGAVKALEGMGSPIKNEKIVLLGLGGAGKAVLTGLALEGAREVSVFVRNKGGEYEDFLGRIRNNPLGKTEAKISLFDMGNPEALKGEIRSAALLINATSVGMGKNEGKSLIPDISYLRGDLRVMDVIYSPEETELLRQAREAGCKSRINGLDMLLFQGTEAFRLFTGVQAPEEVMRNAL